MIYIQIDKDKLHPLECIDGTKTIKDVAYILGNDTPDALFVVENDQIVGIVTDTDLIMKITKKDLGSDDIQVKDIMSSPVMSIDIKNDVKDVIDIMLKKDIQKLLVTDNGKPIGVVYGEDVLKLDPEKWKKLLFRQTIKEVYNILKNKSDISFTATYNAIADMDKFSDLDSDVEFNLYVYQEGLVLVAYNYIKTHPNKKLNDIMKTIKENYSKLLDKYSK